MTIDADQLAALNATRDRFAQTRYVRPVPIHALEQATENPKVYGGQLVRLGVLDRRLSGTRLATEPIN